MKISLLIACLVAFVTIYVEAAPRDIEELALDNLYQVEEERADRHRRITCDLLSYEGKVGDSACAADCLAKGKTGGRCNNGVCQCRKVRFKGLFG